MSVEDDETASGGDRGGRSADRVVSAASRLGRLASGAFGAVTGDGGTSGGGSQPRYPRLGRLRKLMLPLTTLALLGLILFIFHDVLLPFILACFIVYLMEPIVSRIGRGPGRGRGLPRWVAVILVYVVFLGLLTTSLVLIVPRFVTEIVRFAQTVPELITEVRAEHLPQLNRRMQGFLESHWPARPGEGGHAAGGRLAPQRAAMRPEDVAAARQRASRARQQASAQVVAMAEARRRLKLATEMDIVWQMVEPQPLPADTPQLDGEAVELERRPGGDGTTGGGRGARAETGNGEPWELVGGGLQARA